MSDSSPATAQIHPCFFECECACGAYDKSFDDIAKNELVTPPRLVDLYRQNITWYLDRSEGEHHAELWDLGNRSGLYFMWHKNDYCANHDMFHMRALYVGKGKFSQRMRSHWKSKSTEDAQLIYFTFAELPNRVAKNAEQLILDCYNLPLNKAENKGLRRLCAHFTQSEVD